MDLRKHGIKKKNWNWLNFPWMRAIRGIKKTTHLIKRIFNANPITNIGTSRWYFMTRLYLFSQLFKVRLSGTAITDYIFKLRSFTTTIIRVIWDISRTILITMSSQISLIKVGEVWRYTIFFGGPAKTKMHLVWSFAIGLGTVFTFPINLSFNQSPALFIYEH